MDIHIDMEFQCRECGKLNRRHSLNQNEKHMIYRCEHCGAVNRIAAEKLIQTIKAETLKELKRHLSDRLK